MKKYIKLTITLLSLILLLVFVSCGEKAGLVSSEETGTVSISLGPDSRTYDPSIDVPDLTDFVLTGSWTNGNKHTENEPVYTWSDYETLIKDSAIQVKYGTWIFKLSAKKGQVVYTATSDATEVNYNTNAYVSFDLELTSEPEDGEGTLNLSLDWDSNREDYEKAYKAVVTVKKVNAAETLVKTETYTEIADPFVYETTLPKGSYYISTEFFAKNGNTDVSLGVWDEIANIATDHTTTAESYVNFNSPHKIEWMLNYGEWKAGTVIPVSYSSKEGLTLPDPSCIEREGYYFYGWSLNNTSYYQITKIEPGETERYVYANWGRINPVAAQDGIQVEMILPENTYYVDLYRVPVVDGDPQNSEYVWRYEGDWEDPETYLPTNKTITDIFAENGKTYYYNYSACWVENGYPDNTYSNSNGEKLVTAINTNVPYVAYVPENITADFMTDTLVFNENDISVGYFDDKTGFTKKINMYYGNDTYGTDSFDLMAKSYSYLHVDKGWRNIVVEPRGIELSYVSSDGKETYFSGINKEFNENFPELMLHATSDHTILEIEQTAQGHLLTVFIPAETKLVDLGFCRIGNGTDTISNTDTTVKVLNKYLSPDVNNSTRYQAVYYDAQLNRTDGRETEWYSGLEETEYETTPELQAGIEAAFDEETNTLVLQAVPQVNFGENTPAQWYIEFVYYFNNDSNYRIKTDYTGGAQISTPLSFAPNADSVHNTFKYDDGAYIFNLSNAYIKIPGTTNITYTIQLDNSLLNNVQDSFTLHKKQTVTFDTDGADVAPAQVLNYGSYASKPTTDPVKEGYIFGGWFKSGEDLSFDFANTQIYSDITLKAKWLVDAVPEYSVILTVTADDMPTTYTIDEENKRIYFEFPYFADIYIDGEYYTYYWYSWIFTYKDLPKGIYVIDLVQSNDYDQVNTEPGLTYSYSVQVEIQ